jgi:thioesterase DpgC
MAWDALAAYDTLTGGGSRALRVDELCRLAAERFPAMLPGADALAAEAALPQGKKKGLEKAQGRFLGAVLADPRAGTHLCRSKLLPREDAAKYLAQFESQGEL